MRASINPPSLPPGAPHRITECSFATEPSFQALAVAAERAGWTAEEVTFALFDLALQRILTLNAGLTAHEAVTLVLKELNRV